MTAILLGLSCSLAWGVADYVAGVESRRRALAVVLVVSQAAGMTGALVIVLVSGEVLPDLGTAVAAAASGGLLITAIASFYHALTMGKMGVVAPVVATSAVIPVLAGIAAGDRLSTGQAVGIVMCCVGVVLATRHKPDENDGYNLRRGVGFALIAMASFGCFLVLFEGASSDSLFWSVTLSRAVAMGAVLAWLSAAAGAVPRLRQQGGWRLAAIGLLDICALTCFGLAAERGLLSVVAVLASLYPAVTVVLARLLLDERLARVQAAGIAMALTGVVALAAA